MAFSTPKYIEDAGIAGYPVNYEWAPSRARSYWAHGVAPLERKIGKIAIRSRVVLIAGISDWVARRLSKHSEDHSLFDCIEAVYASAIDWRYFNPPNKPIKWRKDPVLGPMDVAVYLLTETLDRAKSEEYVADMAVYACNLVEHVLGDKVRSFRSWRNRVVERLQKLEPFNLSEPKGHPVPKEILDPEFDLKPKDATRLLGTFLARLDAKDNPYLTPPEKMLQAGFEGIPYQL